MMRSRRPVGVAAAIAGLAALAVTGTVGLTAPVQAKTHDVKFTAMETEIVVEAHEDVPKVRVVCHFLMGGLEGEGAGTRRD